MKAPRAIVILLIAAAGVTGPAPAMAQNDDVYVNPDSPSGVEYDLPLERARRNSDSATPEVPAASSGSEETPPSAVPFGEGVGPATGDAATGTPTDGDTAERKAAERPRTTGRAAQLPPEVVAAAARPVSAENGFGSTLLYAALGALVVLAGALAGLFMRRRDGGER